MEQRIVFLLCAILVVPLAAQKTYRNDYVYDSRTDAFYKLHIHGGSIAQRQEVCQNEGATLISRLPRQKLLQIQTMMRWQTTYIDEFRQSNRYLAEDQPLLDLESEAQDMLEMTCSVSTLDGYVMTSGVYRDGPFVCKVNAVDVPYNSQCRTHVKGYRYHASVGSCYKIPQIVRNWREAGAQCEAEGAHLAVINSQQEATLLKELTAPIYITGSACQPSFHIGYRATKTTEPRVWRTIFNESFEEAGFSTWLPGEPNSIYENCGGFMRTEGKLNDVPCDCLLGFICEKEVICNH